MGTPDANSDPLDALKLAILNFKVKFVIWHSKRPYAVKAGLILLLLCGFIATNVRITVVSNESASASRTLSAREHRLERNTKLRELFNSESPILLDLDGIRDPYPTDLEEYKKKLFKENMFNTWISDHTPINRLHPDMRTQKCHERFPSYLPVSEMPSISIVFIFVDECLSVLLRSIISIILTTPPELLHDIVLVDDFSKKVENGKRLEEELMIFGDLTKLVRHESRSGLMVARTTGAEHAEGDVLVFLDSHIEALPYWAEPIMDRIARNRKTVVQPNIPAIEFNTFELIDDTPDTPSAHSFMGGFSWDMVFRWKGLPQREKSRRHGDNSVEVRSPTMAGGLFAMDRKYFFELGAYDQGMDVWGSENLEISFRIWMCGGILEISTCSTIAHVYRKTFPYSSKKDVGAKNAKRLAEVWLDEYKDFFYQISPPARSVDMGDISSRVDLRKRLQCKSFKWFLETVYPEMDVPSRDYIAHGEIRNMGTKNRCVDNLGGWSPPSRIGMYSCHGQGGSQYWQFDKRTNEIKQSQNAENCLDAVSRDQIQLGSCHGQKGNQHWTLNTKGEITTSGGLCLGHDNTYLNVGDCTGIPEQRWQWGFVFQQPVN
ncbi:polypeptide N-acetylgalactosaminyltransferase 13-like [Bolinopsis microptera]|uniref:polypeptide N-acetylgalactosaminyltransferase 13-like n=1 Tax=Bolinopsis microptera TaxID=2820187 RepID=UPI00307A9F57